jgi:hypothetical protein
MDFQAQLSLGECRIKTALDLFFVQRRPAAAPR